MIKIGFCGTNSSGKSTLTYEALWKLKKLGVRCDGVLKQDRRLAFEANRNGEHILDVNELAHWSLVANQIKAETDMSLRPGLEMLISDRTVLDFYAYYASKFGSDNKLFSLTKTWLDTYDRIYLLRPVAWQEDAGRPPKHISDSMHNTLLTLALTAFKYYDIDIEPETKEQSKKWRKDIITEIIKQSGRSTKLSVEKTRRVRELLKGPYLIGGSYAFGIPTTASDVDIYTFEVLLTPEAKQAVQEYLGVDVEFHIIPRDSDIIWKHMVDVGFIEVV